MRPQLDSRGIAYNARVTTTTKQAAFLTDLDEHQREAVLHDGAPCAVLAGPGAGKTRVIIHRLMRLLAPVEEGGLGAEPESVVAIAFTIKSADQLRDRLAESLTPSVAARVNAGTCHALGRRLLDRFADTIDLPPVRSVCDSAQRRRLMREIVMETGALEGRRAEGIESLVSLALRFVERCQIDAVEPERMIDWLEQRTAMLTAGELEFKDAEEEAAERARLARDSELATLYGVFHERRLRKGMLMLDDYINLPAKILREQPFAAAIIRDEVRHVVVDEFQDWNPAQIEFLAQLIPGESASGPTNPDLFVVGDDDQSIYAFRGADDRAFDRFERQWPGSKTLTLTRNYRSAPIIVATGNAIIGEIEQRFAPDKEIGANPDWGVEKDRGDGSLEGVIVDQNADNGLVIAAMIMQDREQRKAADGSPPPFSDYAVIARGTAEVDMVANELEIAGLPVDARRKPTPLDDDGVQDLLAWMRLLEDPTGRADIQRLLLRPPMAAATAEVEEWTRTHQKRRTQGADEQPFIEWLDAEHAEHESVAWLLERFGSFRAQSAKGDRADRVVESIIRETSVAHAEGLEGRQRASRIENLVRILRFVRQVTPNLDQPRGLREFWSYYKDLDPKEQQFEIKGDAAVDREDGDEGGADAVTVITAHSAKGLEFDTVFLPKVRPRGYPMSKISDGEDVTLPLELTGREPSSHEDEERRTFYVACTRAERRLVLLAEFRKNKPRVLSGQYFVEITDMHTELGMVEQSGKTWLERISASEASTAFSGDDEEASVTWLRRQHEGAMIDAINSLHRASCAGITDADLDRITADLRAKATELAAIGNWQGAGAAAGLSADDEATRHRLVEIDERMSRGDFDEGGLTRRMKGPLRLSYSKITAYQSCPRCFYVKYVLGLDESKTSQLYVGDIIHKAIEAHSKDVATAEAEGQPAPGVESLVARGLAMARLQLAGDESDEATLVQVEALLNKYATEFIDEAQLLEAEMSVNMPWRLDSDQPDAPMHILNAKIDRVDLLTSGAHRIVDYKTGKATKALTEPKKYDLQMCIYLMAFKHAMGMDETPAGTAEYWVLSTGDKGILPFADMQIDKASEKINKAAQGMLAGEFEQGKQCRGHCGILDG